MKSRILLTLFTLAFAVLTAGSALALPDLQIYIEGATYNDATEAWITESTASLRLWALADSHKADFSDANAQVHRASRMGRIDVYEIDYSLAAAGTSNHFDLYDFCYNRNRFALYLKAPVSHDDETTSVPEPGTLVLLGMGAAGLAARVRKRAAK